MEQIIKFDDQVAIIDGESIVIVNANTPEGIAAAERMNIRIVPSIPPIDSATMAALADGKRFFDNCTDPLVIDTPKRPTPRIVPDFPPLSRRERKARQRLLEKKRKRA